MLAVSIQIAVPAIAVKVPVLPSAKLSEAKPLVFVRLVIVVEDPPLKSVTVTGTFESGAPFWLTT